VGEERDEPVRRDWLDEQIRRLVGLFTAPVAFAGGVASPIASTLAPATAARRNPTLLIIIPHLVCLACPGLTHHDRLVRVWHVPQHPLAHRILATSTALAVAAFSTYPNRIPSGNRCLHGLHVNQLAAGSLEQIRTTSRWHHGPLVAIATAMR
jgi:hypothetical protein